MINSHTLLRRITSVTNQKWQNHKSTIFHTQTFTLKITDLNTSAGFPKFPCMSSGAMYTASPSTASLSLSSSDTQSPKSPSLQVVPSLPMKMLAGLMSKWHKRLSWRCFRPCGGGGQNHINDITILYVHFITVSFPGPPCMRVWERDCDEMLHVHVRTSGYSKTTQNLKLVGIYRQY